MSSNKRGPQSQPLTKISVKEWKFFGTSDKSELKFSMSRTKSRFSMLNIKFRSWKQISSFSKKNYVLWQKQFFIRDYKQTKLLNMEYWTLAGSKLRFVICSIGYGLGRSIQVDAFKPCFIKNVTVVGDSYKKMPRFFLFPWLRDNYRDQTFQQDWAPLYYAHIVRNYLNKKTGTSWIGES